MDLILGVRFDGQTYSQSSADGKEGGGGKREKEKEELENEKKRKRQILRQRG